MDSSSKAGGFILNLWFPNFHEFPAFLIVVTHLRSAPLARLVCTSMEKTPSRLTNCSKWLILPRSARRFARMMNLISSQWILFEFFRKIRKHQRHKRPTKRG
eukprot:s878_g19.t1